MSTTLPMSVTEARRRLADTSRLSSERVDELQQVIDAFHAARPVNRACAACSSMRWSEHATADGDASWACAGCHRPASLTAEAWHAQVVERAQVSARASLAAAQTRHEPVERRGGGRCVPRLGGALGVKYHSTRPRTDQ